MRFKLLSLVSLMTLLLSTSLLPALAQETTGVIHGVVRDPGGAVVPGAKVEVSGTTLIGTRAMETGPAGRYRFVSLPPGVYVLKVAASGFRQAIQSEINLELGKELKIDFSLEVGQMTQTVEVVADALIVDTTSSKAGVNVSEQVITYLPKGRSFTSLINLAPGARQEPLQSRSASGFQPSEDGFQIDGASDGENVYTFDGLDTTDIQNAGTGVQVPVDFVQEVQIKSSGFAAEYGGALGGVVNVIGKRGGNEWHGAGILYYRTSALDASPRPSLRRNPEASIASPRLAEPAEYYEPRQDSWRRVEPGFELGGSIVQDRLWLYASYIPNILTLSRTVQFDDPADGTRTFHREDKTHFALARLDYRVHDTLRTSASWHYAYRRVRGLLPDRDSEDGLVNGDAETVASTFRPETGQVSPNSTYTATVDWTPTSRLLVSGRVGFWDTDIQDRGRPQGIRYQYSGSAVQGLDGTVVPFPFDNRSGFQTLASNFQTNFDVKTRTAAAVDVAYFAEWAGTHNFKFGYAMNRLANDLQARYVDSRVILVWNQEYSPALADGILNCAAIDAANGGEGCRGNFGYYRLRDFEQSGDVSSFNHSFYLQDAWTVARGLTLNVGVRFDKEYLPSFTDAENVLARPVSFGFGDKVAPRLGAAWDVTGTGKMKVFGSWGFFYDIMKYEMPRGLFGGDYWHDCVYTLDTFDYTTIVPVRSGPGGHFCAGAASGGPGSGQPGTFIEEEDFRIPANDPNEQSIEPNLKPMRQWEAILGTEFALKPDLGVEVRWARKRLTRTIEDVGVLDQLVGERFIISNPGEGITEFPLAADCPTCPAMPKPVREYDGVEFRMTKRWSNNWYGSASYTWSRLYGNYSGLTSTDENGRHSPNVNRFFDEQTTLFDASGNPALGRLATDRPHTFKFYGSYRLRWLGMESTFGFNQLVFSGSPITTMIPVITSAPVPVAGRGNFTPLTRDPATGDWVAGTTRIGARTPMFTNTDFSLVHEFALSRTNEQLRATIEFNVLNLLNERNVTRVDNTPLRTGRMRFNAIDANGTPFTDYLAFFGGFDWAARANSQNLVLDTLYGLPNAFQRPRAFRLKLKVSF